MAATDSAPYEAFGKLVTSFRLQAGLAQQSDLASLLKTTQQTVSRWEAGLSRPRDKQMPLLATVLQVDVAELLAAAGYTARIPVATFDQPFPIDALSPDSFERFCLYFLFQMYPDAAVHRVGGPGHTQDGLDVDAIFPDGTSFSFQCKRVDDFGPSKVRSAVTKHTRPANKKFLLLTRPAASPQARQTINEYSDWDIWDREDVSRLIRQSLSKDQQLRLVDTFFHGQRLALLGETEAGPWQTSDQFFGAFGPGQKAFSHQWQLVGRDPDLGAISGALSNHGVAITLLIGSGGSGKSRVLKQAIEEFELTHPDVLVRFLSPTESLTNKSLEDLGTHAKLLIVDDAHEHEDLQLLFQYAATPANKTVLLLSLRPYGLEHVKGQATSFALNGDRVVERKLAPLTLEQATQLATEVLTKFGGPVAAAKEIARLTLDCPLFTVVGSQVVAEENIPLELAKNEGQFRNTLLARFQDIIAGHIGSKSDADQVRKLLKILALVQPFYPEDHAVSLAAEQIEGIHPSDVSRLIRLLVEAGVLFKRGGKHRLSPDLLADHIIETNCISVNGGSTGYAERVIDATKQAQLENVLLNLGKLDWRLTNGDPSNSRLLDGVWQRLQPSSKYADPCIAAVKAVAFYQPQRALAFVEKLIREGTYLEDLPNVIKHAAYNFEYLQHACECLWHLGKKDARVLNSNPGHAIRVLSELAAVEPNKPIAFNEAIVDFAISLLKQNDSWTGSYTPFDLLSGFMQTEGHTTTSNGRAITFGPFLVSPEATRSGRAKVVDATIALLTHSNTRIAVLAAKFAPNCLRYPMGQFGTQVDPRNRDTWTEEFVRTLEKIEQVVKTNQLDPLVLIQITRGVSWLANFAQNEASPVAQRIISLLPSSLEFRTVLAMEDGYGHSIAHADFKQQQLDRAEFMDVLVRDLISKFSDGEELRIYLALVLGKIKEAHPEGISSAYVLFEGLIRESYALAKAIAENASNDTASITARFSGISLSRILAEDHLSGVALAERFLETDVSDLQAAIGRAYCLLPPKEKGYEESDLRLIRAVLSSKNEWVVRNGIEAVRTVASYDKRLAIDLLALVDIAMSNGVADEVFILFQRDESIPFRSLTSSDIKHFLDALLPLATLDGYWVETFLSRASKYHALSTAKFFMSRVEHAASQNDWNFRPCNYGPYIHVPLRFRESAEFAVLLREVCHWMTTRSDGNLNFEYRVGELFEAMFKPFDDEIISFIRDWIEVAPASDIRVIARILKEAESSFVFVHRDLVTRFLERANQYGKELLDISTSSLIGAAISGVKSSIPGEPCPADIATRDEAEKAMQAIPRFAPARALYETLQRHANDCIQRAIMDRESFDEE
jgi:transcriptional regulator with XRE-family HTH domain